jgi:hypothetical protein
MTRILVVANKTLGGSHLLAAIRRRMEAGPVELDVVVPATAPANGHVHLLVGPGMVGPVSGALRERADSPAEDAYALAEQRLEAELVLLGELGVRARGEVGHEDPMHAVNDAFARGGFDEVIVSTLPVGASRWLHTDLPHRIARKHHVPVETVTARASR